MKTHFSMLLSPPLVGVDKGEGDHPHPNPPPSRGRWIWR